MSSSSLENQVRKNTKICKSIHSPHFGLSDDSEYTQTKYISCLLPEILTLIFTFLDLSDKGRVSQVCLLWRDSAYNRQVWKNVEAKLHLNQYIPSLFSSLVRRGIKKIQILSFKKNIRYLVLQSLSTIESLNLRGCYKLTDSSFSYLLNRKLSSLTSLNISLCKQITDNTLSTISENLPSLTSLNISGCSNVTGNGILSISSTLTNLKVLKMRSLRHLTDECIQYITGKSYLKIPGLLQLEILDLQDCQRIKDDSLFNISETLTHLKCLNLNFCNEITDHGLLHLSCMPSLQGLSLRLCSNIGDLGIAHLAASSNTQLTSLDVSFCDHITDHSLISISQGIFQLRSLGLSACPITDVGISTLVQTTSNLRAFHLGQCTLLSDKCIDSISKQLPSLEHLDLYGCLNISKHKISSLTYQMPSLKCLKLDI